MSEKIATPIIQPRVYFSKNDKPLVGGKVYAFKISENEFKPTFRNAELTALNQNPIVLDQAGSCLIYMKGAVRLQVFDKNNVFIEERVVYQQRQIAQFFDKYGKVLSFGKVQTLDYQSTIKKASYKNSDLNQNPVLLDENGCAEISIAGAYRLRSYDKSGVFITDQDFKRLPARALTSRPYPIYFDESVATEIKNSELISKTILNYVDACESTNSSFSLNSIVMRSLLTEADFDSEKNSSSFKLNKIVVFLESKGLSQVIDNTSSKINIKSIKQANIVVKTTLEIEKVKTTFNLSAIQIK